MAQRYNEPPWKQVFPDLKCSRLRMSINYAIVQIIWKHEDEEGRQINA